MCPVEGEPARRHVSTPRYQEFSQWPATEAASLADPNRNQTRLQKIYGMLESDSMDERNGLTGSRLAVGVDVPDRHGIAEVNTEVHVVTKHNVSAVGIQ